MKIERLIGIILYLLNRKSVTANQLAEHFKVSKRTILRDIDTLTLAGVPIYSEIGVKGGYSINKDFELNEKIMDGANLEYLLLALESLKSVYGNQKVVETYEKAVHVYSKQFALNKQKLEIDFSVVNENVTVIEQLSNLKYSILNNRVISFQYTNSKGKSKAVTLNPLHAFYKWYSWYLFGYDNVKQEFLLYKIVRMSNLEISDENFDNKYDVPQLLKDYEIRRKSQNILVSIKYPKEINPLIDEYFSGEIILEDEKYMVRHIMIKENDLMSFSLILGFGNKLEILSPEFYRDKVILHCKQIIENY